MSCLRPFGLKCITVILAAQLYAVPAVADNVRAGGFIIIGSEPLSLHLRSKHHVQRYYGAPKVYHRSSKHKHQTKPKVYYHKSKPKVHYVKPVKRHHRSRQAFSNKHASPYYLPRSYGIQNRGYRYGIKRRRY